MSKPLTLTRLRRMAIAASFRAPAPLGAAIRAMGFVQADPIRAPARAQDLILRHRVADYRAGDVQRQFSPPAGGGGFPLRLRYHAARHLAAPASAP